MCNTRMEDKEKLVRYLENHDGNFETLILGYMGLHSKEFPTNRLVELVNLINTGLLLPKTEAVESANFVAYERASYLKDFLEGKMYTSREAAEQAVPVQINNAKTIIDACKSARN